MFKLRLTSLNKYKTLGLRGFAIFSHLNIIKVSVYSRVEVDKKRNNPLVGINNFNSCRFLAGLNWAFSVKTSYTVKKIQNHL